MAMNQQNSPGTPPDNNNHPDIQQSTTPAFVQPPNSINFGYPVQPHSVPDFDHFAQMAVSDDPVSSTNTHLWLVDSGATNHYTALCSLLQDFSAIKPIPVLTGRGYIFARGVGNINIRLAIGLVTVKNVMWIPELAGHASLLSVPQLAHSGSKITFEADLCQIYKNDYLLATASFNGKAYYLDVEVFSSGTHHALVTIHSSLQPIGNDYKLSGYNWLLDTQSYCSLPARRPKLELAMLHGTSDTQPIDIWHKLLGHLNHDDIRLLTTMATGINIGPQHLKDYCVSCLHGKQHRHISHVPRTPTKKKLEIIHIDIKGPCDTGVNDFRYWANFMDEKT